MYCGEGVRKLEQNINDLIREEEENSTLIVGDWNSRIRKKGEIYIGEEEEAERISKDKTTNVEGGRMLKIIEEMRWRILNG